MGYRSDVKLITTKKGWDRIQREVGQASPDNWKLTCGDLYTRPLCDGKYILLEHYDIKWYDHFPEVSALMRELKRFDAEHIPYQFMRVGEDWGDNEYLYERDWKSDEYDDMPSLTLKSEIEVEY